MSTAEFAGFVALISAGGNVTVYGDSPVPNSPSLPYVVVYGSDLPEESSFGSDGNLTVNDMQTTCVGVNQAQALALRKRLNDRLVDQRPTATGRSCGLVSKTSSQKVRPDQDVSPAVFIATDLWSFTSVPS